jgi:hypothetical protein
VKAVLGLTLVTLALAGCATHSMIARTATGPRPFGYTIAADQVVFMFRPLDYAFMTRGPANEWVAADSVRIDRVAVAGEFNRWSTDALPMARAGDAWTTTRPIREFESERPLQFKFVINGQFWAEPPAEATNRAPAPDNSHVANLRLILNQPPKTHR